MNEYIAKENDFSYWENEPRIYLDHIDRNGSRYYVDTRCPKCGRTGYLQYYVHVDGGICFKCGGSGEGIRKIIVRTVEYAEKLRIRREKALAVKAVKMNQKFLKEEGFTPEGKTYIVLGDTYSIKDQLKEEGAFYSKPLGWHFNHKPDNHPVKELSIDQPLVDTDGEEFSLLEKNSDGFYYIAYEWEISKIINRYRNEYLETLPTDTEWIGEVGKRITVENCKGSVITSWDTQYGTIVLYKFITPERNILTWKTSKNLDLDTPITLTGTVKAHNKYKSDKQTELTRCKVQ